MQRKAAAYIFGEVSFCMLQVRVKDQRVLEGELACTGALQQHALQCCPALRI